MKARDFAMAAGGALLAGSAVIARYELRAGSGGSSESALGALRASTRAELGAAGGAELSGSASPARGGGDPAGSTQAENVPSSSDPASAGAAGSAQADKLEQLRSKLAGLSREKRDLEAQLQALEGELERKANASPMGDPQEFELDAEGWKALAAQGRIKYRMPCLLPPEASYANMAGALDELGLSPEEGEVLTEVHRRSNARVWAALRPSCLEVVGSAKAVDLLSASNCLSLIQQDSQKKDWKVALAARRRVAEVHAGVAVPPAPAEPEYPLFSALFAVTSESKKFQADLAESFGPEEAKRINDSISCVATQR